MKKMISFLLVCCLTVGIVACGSKPAQNGVEEEANVPQTNLILNADGSFGGSLDTEKYGEGAPKNGQYNVANSDYYVVNNDFYNMTSTENRLVIPRFASYQQTMADSSGLACLLMILNYMGQDVQNKYTEENLLKKYEKVNKTTVYGNGTTGEGLVNLIDNLDLGYQATVQDPNYPAELSLADTKALLWEHLNAGRFVLVRYQSPVGHGWKLVIGYDTQGEVEHSVTGEFSDQPKEDVIIFAEPYDGYDHNQDGYATERAANFQKWWKNMELDGTITDPYSYVVIDAKAVFSYDTQPVDTTVKQELPEKHLPLNPDGTYGGTRDELFYGTIACGRGLWDHTNSNYYKINDFYNMGSEGSRILLSGYTVLQQTMGSSCGLCAIGSVMMYHGYQDTHYNLEMATLNEYERWTGETVKGNGTNVTGLMTTLSKFGFIAQASATSRYAPVPFPTYEKYIQFILENLNNGQPLVVSHNPAGGHYLTIIGYDDMGTEYIYDDVFVIADSNDYWDGYQDGYNIYNAHKFYRQHTNGSNSRLQGYVQIEVK